MRKKQYRARFIGRDGSMGLTRGRIYPLRIWEEPRGFFGMGGRYIVVSWYTGRVLMALSGEEVGVMKCPYGSIDAFLNNWELVRDKPKLLSRDK